VLAVSPDLVALFPVPVLVGLQLFMGLRLLIQWLVVRIASSTGMSICLCR
jgi:hypothetical protein